MPEIRGPRPACHAGKIEPRGSVAAGRPSPLERPVFQAIESPSDRDVAELVAILQRRILRYLARSRRLRREPEEENAGENEEPLLAELYSASVSWVHPRLRPLLRHCINNSD